MFEWFDRQSVSELLELYGLYADVPTAMLDAFLVEKIAGDDRLRGLDENRRAAIINVNHIILEQMIAALDEAQAKYEEAVALPWVDHDHVLLALFLHYATCYALIMHVAPDVADHLKMVVRSWKVDYHHLKRWNDEKHIESDAQRASRAKLYTGNIRGTVFRQHEVGAVKQYSAGWVAYYKTKDANACEPCHDAEGFHLMGQGPFPGQVCKGRARCRCKRIIVWNPAQHKILSGAIDVTAGHRW